MTKTHSPMPFPVHLSVENRSDKACAKTLLDSFIEQMTHKYELITLIPSSGTSSQAEATISVPFADREHIRIDFNIYASEMEDTYGAGTGLYFHMESAFEQ